MATIHNPTHFEPSHYVVLDYVDNQHPFECNSLHSIEGLNLGRCAHCGNGRVRFVTVVRHIPTGETVVFGADCTDRLGFENRMAWKLAELKAKALIGAAKLKLARQVEAFLSTRPALAAAMEQAKQPLHANNTFVADVLGKLTRYGSISDRQVECVLQSLQRDLDKAAAAAQKATQPVEVKGNAPVGRTTVTGVVVGLKHYENDFGVTLKMTVKLANNACVWMTVPQGPTVERGMTITVTATFTVSDRDASFGFGKRPTGLAVAA